MKKHKSRFGVNRDLYIVVIFIKSYARDGTAVPVVAMS